MLKLLAHSALNILIETNLVGTILEAANKTLHIEINKS